MTTTAPAGPDVRARAEQGRQAARRRSVLDHAAVAAGILSAVLAGTADHTELCQAHAALGVAVRELCRGQVV